MKIMIVGCGRVGSRLALRLDRIGHDVLVVDEERETFSCLGGAFRGATFHGSGLESFTLKRAKAAECDVVVAVTGGDNRNLMIAQLAKHIFGVQRVIARLKDPVRAAKYREIGIETLCVTTLVEGLFELWVQNGAFPSLPGEMSACGDCSPLEEF